jgi:phage baseplate assembly protein gpV
MGDPRGGALMSETDGYLGFRGTHDVGSENAALRFVIKSMLAEVATSHVVKVVNARSNGQVAPPGTIDVQILVHQIDGYGNTYPHDTIYNVPYKRNQNGTHGIIMDPVAGDIGVIVCASRDISAVKANNGAASQPGSLRRHDLADALYIGTVIATKAPENFMQFNDQGMALATPHDISITANGTITLHAAAIKLVGPIQQTGGSITSNGKHIDDSHIHGNVQPGGGSTSPPSN